jgi:hypothetical protein
MVQLDKAGKLDYGTMPVLEENENMNRVKRCRAASHHFFKSIAPLE